MEFQTEWNRKQTITNSGDEFLPQYIESVNKDGKRYLKKIKPRNIYDEIQASAEGTSIYEIIDKFAQTGDETLLEQRKGVFANFLNIPTDLREISNKVMEAENYFEQLDKDVRKEFENDVNVFKASIFDGTFEDRIAHYVGEKTKAEKNAELKEQVENQTKSEVKKGE